ncbi:nucleoside hydrolase [Pseudooceanicola nanhaiensis]|uniref:nucleoside hydrolase n=1 Tax=Pseudooceanicola nanhaiensis TaxID=375761 RepID=UPI001CD2F1DF|nr:nucleoside hydrolase [Pseudooceanicola nanhaiensis]MCA0921312.1 nucleoside hydrolase [Pseudooceanicola nanhaiensis]
MKLIIDTDPGIDDAMAVFYAALDPAIELVGLTSVFGNVLTPIATRNALRLAEMAGLDIPVAEGAHQALEIAPTPPSSHIHGVEGFGDIAPVQPKAAALEESAPAFLCRMARELKGELVLCPIGPITNIARAIQLDPEFATNVKEIIFMGGAARVPGNITPHAEANTYHDPHALNVVLGSGAKVTMVGLDVTMATAFTAADFDDLARRDPHLGGFLREAGLFYLEFYYSRGRDGVGLHDPMTLIAAAHPELFVTEEIPLRVVETGEEQGRTQEVAPAEAAGVARVCVGGDMDAIKRQFSAVFGN